MKTRYFTVLATLAFLGFSATAAAHPCKHHEDKSHEHCVAKDGPQTTFMVNMEVGNSLASLLMCNGTATRKNLGPNLTHGLCPVELDGPVYGPGLFCVCGVSVKNTKKSTKVMIFMDDCNDIDFCAVAVWRTLELPAHVEIGELGDFSVILENSGPHELKKNHEPDKELALTDGIYVGPMVYTEVDP